MEYLFAGGTSRHNRRASHAGAARVGRQSPVPLHTTLLY
jgi:hypothetical protein